MIFPSVFFAFSIRIKLLCLFKILHLTGRRGKFFSVFFSLPLLSFFFFAFILFMSYAKSSEKNNNSNRRKLRCIYYELKVVLYLVSAAIALLMSFVCTQMF